MNKLLASTFALAVVASPVMAEIGPLSGVWRNEQDNFMVRIDHYGNTVRATLLTDQQYPGADLWLAGDVDFEGTWDGKRIQGREKIIWTRNVREKCPGIASKQWSSMRLTAETFLAPRMSSAGPERLVGSIDNGEVFVEPCGIREVQRPWSYTRVVRPFENRKAQFRATQPLDTVAADCTPGKLIEPSSPIARRIWGAMAEAERRPVTRTVNRSDPNEYVVFIVTDGTGNHRKQYINDPKTSDADDAVTYTADECRGTRYEIEQATGLLYTQYPTNSAILYNLVATNNSSRLIPIYERGVGTSATTWGLGRKLVGSAVLERLLHDFRRVVDNAYAQAVTRINDAYQRNPKAKFVFITSGFSRGAAAARIINNRLREKGIPDQSRPGKYIVPPGTANIGATVLYDTVVSLKHGPIGVDPYHGSRAFAIPQGVQALHIVAENEYRAEFPLTPAFGPGVHEVRVPGSHSDIGGTYTTDGISAVTLLMGLHYLHAAGVPVGDPAKRFGLKPSYLPTETRFAIHDSRYEPDVPFDEMLSKVKRTIDTRYDSTFAK